LAGRVAPDSPRYRTSTLNAAGLGIRHLEDLQSLVLNPASLTLVAQTVRIEGKVTGTSVEGLTVTIGGSTFSGAGLFVVARSSRS